MAKEVSYMISEDLLKKYTRNVKDIYGDFLSKIILYGSYARGDFTDESDIDVLILLNMTDAETRSYTDSLIDMTYDFNMAYDVDIQPYAKSSKQFAKWVHVDPFYANISREGVVLYEAA